MENTLLHEISWVDAKKRIAKSDMALLPVGSTEQHGPHNPLGIIANLIFLNSSFASSQVDFSKIIIFTSYCLKNI